MKRYTIQIAVLVAVLVTGIFVGKIWFGADSSITAEPTTAAVQDWTCPMHPQIRQPDAGMCPICGMDLVPADANFDTDPGLIVLGESLITQADIQTSRVQTAGRSGRLVVNGRLAVNESALAEQVLHFPGRIEQLLVTEVGSTITAGQPVARVYAPTLVTAQQEWLDARKYGQTALADAAYEKLLRWKITPEQLAQVAATGIPTGTFTILANQSGTVLTRLVNAGDYVAEGAPLFTLASLETLWAWLNVYEQDVAAIRLGQQVRLELTAYPGQTFTGRVTLIDAQVDAATRSIKVRVDVDNKNRLLKPDMFLTASVETGNPADKVLIVPRSAVLWTGPRSVVYVAEEGGFRLREVTLGTATDQGYEVVSGLSEGETIVTKGAFVVDASAELADKTAMMTSRTALASQKEEVTEAFLLQWGEVVSGYLNLKNHLIAGRAPQAAQAAKEMMEALGRVVTTAESPGVASFWASQYVRLQALSKQIAGSDELDQQRKDFIDLSKGMILAAKTLGPPQKLYVQFCPMANDDKGAYWLSESNQVLNPYFGDMMLRCGTVEETLSFGAEN